MRSGLTKAGSRTTGSRHTSWYQGCTASGSTVIPLAGSGVQPCVGLGRRLDLTLLVADELDHAVSGQARPDLELVVSDLREVPCGGGDGRCECQVDGRRRGG